MKENFNELPEVMAQVIGMFMKGEVKPPNFRKFPIDQAKEALAYAMKGYTDEKVLIQFN